MTPMTVFTFATSDTKLRFFDFSDGTVKLSADLKGRGMIICATFVTATTGLFLRVQKELAEI
jgi:hypothetical protein